MTPGAEALARETLAWAENRQPHVSGIEAARLNEWISWARTRLWNLDKSRGTLPEQRTV